MIQQKKRKLTPAQVEIVTEAFSRQRNGESLTSIAKSLRIDRRTLYGYRNSEQGQQIERELKQRLIDDAYVEVMQTLVTKAIEGKSPKYIELYLKATGKLKDVSEVHTRQDVLIQNEAITDDIFAEIDELLKG
ncbi:phBC6A51 family helix-turn-helix protein [Bacillus sp. FJAT-51639]|uniref:PhBC6A51 family helix-turn-helix protein n=1 Tax=Bacillus bruguierae TaxID=3127667 RepID=A0ABU8FCH3_9BACI